MCLTGLSICSLSCHSFTVTIVHVTYDKRLFVVLIPKPNQKFMKLYVGHTVSYMHLYFLFSKFYDSKYPRTPIGEVRPWCIHWYSLRQL